MSRIRIFMLPEPGHLLPTFRFAAALLARGHVVEYLTVPDFQEAIVQQGFKFLPVLPRFFRGGFGIGNFFDMQTAGYHTYKTVFKRLAQENVSPAREIVRDLSSPDVDLVIVDSAACGTLSEDEERSALERLQCPLLRVSATFTEENDGQAVSSFVRNLRELVLCPQALDLPDATARAQTYYVEPSVLRQRPSLAFPWEEVDSDRKLIYCSFGTQSIAYTDADSVFLKLLAACRELDEFQFVIAAGGHRCIPELVPRHVLVRRNVPQLQILERASLVVTHGGLGTIKEAIMAGVPMIVLPFIHDQPRNARRIEHHGLGVSLSASSFSVDDFCGVVRRVTTAQRFDRNVKSFQELFSQVELASPTLDHIAAALNSRNRGTTASGFSQ